MPVSLFAPALLEIARMVERSAAVIYPERSSVKVLIEAETRAGSFEFNLQAIAAVLTGHSVQGALQTISISDLETLLQWLGLRGADEKSLLGLLKRLGTPRVRQATANADGKVNVVFTINGDNNNVTIVNDVQPETVRLLRDASVREAASDLLNPLRHNGVSAFRVGPTTETPSADVLRIERERAATIGKIEPARRVLTESEQEAAVELVSVSFDDDAKWRVRQGESPFWIRITDPDFNDSVRNGYRAFRKGDYLIGTMRVQSFDTPTGIQTERELVRVREHDKREQQGQLL